MSDTDATNKAEASERGGAGGLSPRSLFSERIIHMVGKQNKVFVNRANSSIIFEGTL